jgi:MFS family permease
MVSLLKSSSLLRRFFAARFQSELGTGAAYVALVLVAYQRLHSGWAVALVLLADFLPGIALSAPLGALADRMSRRRLAIAGDVLRAGAFIALALIPSFTATIGLALVAGVGSAVFHPASNAALPDLVSDEQRSPATALYGAMGSIGITVGPALTALLLLLGPATLILAINGATFLISALLLRGVPMGGGGEQTARDAPAAGNRGDETAGATGGDLSPDPGDGSLEPVAASLWSSTLEGLRSSTRIPGVGALLIIGAMSVLASALMNVAEPLLAVGPLGAGSSGYSVLVSVYGVGMAVGSVVNSRAGSLVGGLRRRLLFGIALTGAGMAASAAAPSLDWALGSFAVTGLGNALIIGPEFRLFQELVSPRLLGRVFGLRDALGNVAFVVAFLSAGAVLGLLGVRAVFAVGGVAMIGLAAAGSLWLRPARAREQLAATPERAREQLAAMPKPTAPSAVTHPSAATHPSAVPEAA